MIFLSLLFAFGTMVVTFFAWFGVMYVFWGHELKCEHCGLNRGGKK